MRGFHFSLRWLFGAVSFLALACGLLVYASPFFSKLTFTAAIVVLLTAVFAAVYRTGEHRAFWAGSAAFGFAYLWLTCGSWQSPDGSTALRDRLVTTDLLTRCHERLPSTQPPANMTATFTNAPPNPPGIMYFDVTVPSSVAVDYAVPTGPAMSPYMVASAGVDRFDFLATGHSLFAIIFALMGGAIAQTLCRRGHSTQSKSAG